METVEPDGYQKPSAFEFDLLQLPILRGILRTWHTMLFANSSVRREAKGVLFGELAEAAKRGVPLHVALSLTCQTVDEANASSPRAPKGADTRYRVLSLLYFVLLFCLTQVGGWVYTILSFRFADVERVARLLARRLLRHVERGLSLADAMERCGPDFDPAEVATVRAGVQWGRVPEALKRLGEFQTVEDKLTMQGSQMLYPFLLLFLLSFPVVFVVTRIVPKFVDIFAQLGIAVPPATVAMIRAVHFLSWTPFGLLLVFLVSLLLVFLLVRALMNGNAVSKWPFLLSGALPFIGGMIGLLVAISTVIGGHEFGEDGWTSVGTIGFGLVALGITPWWMMILERIVLAVERFFGNVLRHLPFFLTPVRAEAESRWLGGLALALESGVSEPEALRTVGDICGGGVRSRSHEAARLVEKGHSIGEACLREHVLSDALNHRLVLIGLSDSVTKGLHAAADDAAQRAYECMNRSGRIAEVFALLAIGIVLGSFVVAMYVPLFTIPLAVHP